MPPKGRNKERCRYRPWVLRGKSLDGGWYRAGALLGCSACSGDLGTLSGFTAGMRDKFPREMSVVSWCWSQNKEMAKPKWLDLGAGKRQLSAVSKRHWRQSCPVRGGCHVGKSALSIAEGSSCELEFPGQMVSWEGLISRS